MSPAKILAIETSGRQGSVAIALGSQLLAERELPPGMRHAVELMPMIRQLTQTAGWNPNDINEIYLSLGPGSFTGLRISVAIARALHQAIGCRLVGVPSLDVIAANAPENTGIILPILDAKRGQVFSARYERQTTSLVQTLPPALVDPAAFVQSAVQRARQMLAAGETAPLRIALLGEGVDYHRDALFTATQPVENIQLLEIDRALWHGRARNVHRLGLELAARGSYSDPAKLLPLYIRLPEAEEVYQKKHGSPIPNL